MLWGGRFTKEIDEFFLDFSSSIRFDINLIKYDLNVSRAHAKMLGKCKIISRKESGDIIRGLNLVEAQFIAGNWKPLEGSYEDIHSAIEMYLKELIGDTAAKLHTGRSRNDQVATGFRMWIKDACLSLQDLLTDVQKSLLIIAGDNINTIVPGYTHLQRAQPVSFAFHLLAYVEMFERDKNRFKAAFNQADVCPLGSGALAGTTLPIDRKMTAKALGFSKVAANAMDAISDRDFVIEFLNACSIGMMHLSRLSEELVIWSSQEWTLIKMDDSVTTGSSLMPQKKNPDAAELIRGKIGRVYGNYTSVISMMKGLPLSYNRDMQEDKEPAFDSFNTYSASLKLIKMIFDKIEVKKERFIRELQGDYMLSTDIADWLVLKGVPFRQAHEIVGKLVSYAISKKKKLDKLSLKELKSFDPIFDESAKEYLDINTSLKRKKSFGSPNPDLVTSQINRWEKELNFS